MDLESATKITIGDKPLFDTYLKKYSPEISELTFTNLFIWQDYYETKFFEWNDHLIIFSDSFFQKSNSYKANKQNLFLLPPIGPSVAKIITNLYEEIVNIEVHRCPRNITEEIKTYPTFSLNQLTIFDDRNNWDYVYDKNDLINLSGNKFYQKRKLLKRFNQKYKHKFQLLNEELLEDCKKLQLEWCNKNECMLNEDLQQEQKAILKAIDHYSELNYRGGVLFIEDECVAYTFGELLNKDTLVIHVEKAHVEYEGAYQAINNFFIKKCCKDVKYVNREQDLGSPGLRQAKSTYNPHHMIEKQIIHQIVR
ncbi:MAG: DUF2156 domain-containing protein [Candidatus Lokiarchaeota archaeon]|nr:DUF2156 domain-containing protein [Candidatus Lokiarchaeota archaeon]